MVRDERTRKSAWSALSTGNGLGLYRTHLFFHGQCNADAHVWLPVHEVGGACKGVVRRSSPASTHVYANNRNDDTSNRSGDRGLLRAYNVCMNSTLWANELLSFPRSRAQITG